MPNGSRATCSPDGDVAADPPGFDRAAFLKQLADDITAFFDKALHRAQKPARPSWALRVGGR